MAKSILVLVALLLIVSVYGRPKHPRDESEGREFDDEDEEFEAFRERLENAVKQNSSAIVAALRSCPKLRKAVCNSSQTTPSSNATQDLEWLFALAQSALNKTKQEMAAVFMSEPRLPGVLCHHTPSHSATTTPKPTTSPPTTAAGNGGYNYDDYLSILSKRKKRSLTNRRAKPIELKKLRPEVDEVVEGNGSPEEVLVEPRNTGGKDEEYNYTTVITPTSMSTAPTMATTTTSIRDEGQFDEAIVIDPNRHDDELTLEGLPREKVDEANPDTKTLDRPLDSRGEQNNKENFPALEPGEPVDNEEDHVIDKKYFFKADEEPMEKNLSILDDIENPDENNGPVDASEEVLKEDLLDSLADDFPKPKPKVGRETKYEEDDVPETLKKL